MSKNAFNSKSNQIIGIMSGTSMDAVDACLVNFIDKDFWLNEADSQVSITIPKKLKQELQKLTITGGNEIHRSQIASINIANLYAKAVKKLLKINGLSSKNIKVIGAHGQTIRHMPNNRSGKQHMGYSVQLLNGAVLAEKTAIDVVYDFRARDIAAGGQGAPLIPAFHMAIYQKLITQKKHSPKKPLILLNIGGMANLTICVEKKVFGCDSGPGNCLLDAWTEHCYKKSFDKNGKIAKSGKVSNSLLTEFYQHKFFGQKPPKSCGAEEFNLKWLLQIINSQSIKYNDNDVLTTLCELTAISIVDSLLALFKKLPNSYVKTLKNIPIMGFGGGINNGYLLSRIISRCQIDFADVEIMFSDEIGIPSQAMEASAFAWLAWRRINSLPATVTQVTGAEGKRSLGVIALAI